MPRHPRFILPGHPQHVIIRGLNHEPVFFHESDYWHYLFRLQQAMTRHDCALHAYVLMTDHVHLLLTPAANNSLAKSMQMLGRHYVQYFNANYSHTGTLWEGRYRSALLESKTYLLTCYRYIELNPVRAKRVKHPCDYPWSSYHCNANGHSDPLLTSHQLYNQLGITGTLRQQVYREMSSKPLNAYDLDKIRLATNKGWVLGSETFKAEVARILQRRTSPLPRGGDRKSRSYSS